MLILGVVSGCLRRFIGLAVLVALLGVGWYYRDAFRGVWREWRAAESPVAVAERAAPEATARAKLARLAAGETERPAISFSEEEARVLFREYFADAVPVYVDSPTVAFEDGRVRLQGRIATGSLPPVAGLARIAAFLPDTAEVGVLAELLPLAGARVALAVDDVSIANIPVPDRFIPDILCGLGRADAPGLPPDALALSLPPGAAAAYVRGDSLVLLAAERRRPPRP